MNLKPKHPMEKGIMFKGSHNLFRLNRIGVSVNWSSKSICPVSTVGEETPCPVQGRRKRSLSGIHTTVGIQELDMF